MAPRIDWFRFARPTERPGTRWHLLPGETAREHFDARRPRPRPGDGFETCGHRHPTPEAAQACADALGRGWWGYFVTEWRQRERGGVAVSSRALLLYALRHGRYPEAPPAARDPRRR